MSKDVMIFDDDDNNNTKSVNFDFFKSDKAVIKKEPAVVDDKQGKRAVKAKSEKKDIVVNKNNNVDNVNYADSYAETNSLILGTIAQVDTLASEIKSDINDIRGSKTLKNKYTYITNMTASASSLLNTKIAAIRELNSTITQSHNLELNRLKALKLDAKDENDDKRLMDMYSAFVNTPVGSYNPNTAPTLQDINVGVNGAAPINPIDMIITKDGSTLSGNNISPEQNRMRMEANPNIQTVVRYNQSTGQRYFDVVDKTTGASIPNYPRPDSFLLEDTSINVHDGIARNRNINTVWPLMIEGDNGIISEY